MHRPPMAPALVLLLAALTPAAIAQSDPPETEQSDTERPQAESAEQTPEEQSPDSLSLSVYLEGVYNAHTDFDDDIGELKLTEYHAGINAIVRTENAGVFNIGFDAGLLDYDITPSATSVAGDAADIGQGFEDIHTLSLIAIYTDAINESTNWFAGAGVISAGEKDADFDETIDWLGTAGFSHKFSDKLQIGIGVLVKTRLDDDLLIVPIPQIRYDIDERWSISSERAGLKINYKASDALSYGVTGEYDTISFRLDDSHALAPEAMATHRRIPIAAYAVYTPSPAIEIRGRIGTALGGELEILDDDGDEIASQDIDAAIFGSLTVSFRF
ncbi:MAG: hypothetical protein WD114_00905 [Phycisphaerales bacterium]